MVKQYYDKNNIPIRIGDKIKRIIPVAYIGGSLPEPVIGTVIEENGELVQDDGKYKTPIKNWNSSYWEILFEKKKKKPTKKLDSHDLGGGYIGEALLSCT
jgi:hypothetical protein